MPQRFKWDARRWDGNERNTSGHHRQNFLLQMSRENILYDGSQPTARTPVLWNFGHTALMAKVILQYSKHSSAAASVVCLSVHELWVVLWNCASLAHAVALLENVPVHTLTHLAECVFHAPARLAIDYLALLVNSSMGASGCRGFFNAPANG